MSNNIGPTGTAIVRTVVPFIVGFIVALAAKSGLEIDSAAVEAGIVPVVGTLYYAGVLWLQKNVSPVFGWLLGSPALPDYDNGKVIEGEVVASLDLPDESPADPDDISGLDEDDLGEDDGSVL